jgi:DNA-binding Lrp family transcriptional regulator
MTVTATDLFFADRWQREFPLTERPFLDIGFSAGIDEDDVIATFERLLGGDVISRVGAIVRPRTIGSSTLAALSVPSSRMEHVVSVVSEEPLVTHNYEREHALNLWFVITGPDAGAIDRAIERIENRTGLSVVNLPLLKAYHLDLGFALTQPRKRSAARDTPVMYRPDLRDRSLLAAIEDGIPLVARPFKEVAERIGIDESVVIHRLQQLLQSGIITRFGCVVRHRTLGFTANAMTVWNVPDAVVDVVASHVVKNPGVTLCYQRRRHSSVWPYNLFCMVHAKSREEALTTVADLNATAEIGLYEQAVLFSTRCFKQRGALFSDPTRESRQ